MDLSISWAEKGIKTFQLKKNHEWIIKCVEIKFSNYLGLFNRKEKSKLISGPITPWQSYSLAASQPWRGRGRRREKGRGQGLGGGGRKRGADGAKKGDHTHSQCLPPTPPQTHHLQVSPRFSSDQRLPRAVVCKPQGRAQITREEMTRLTPLGFSLVWGSGFLPQDTHPVNPEHLLQLLHGRGQEEVPGPRRKEARH